MTAKEQMLFKEEYSRRLKINPKKEYLTPYELKHKDFWANRIFGNPSFAFMFPILIPNVKYATNSGYEVIDMWKL